MNRNIHIETELKNISSQVADIPFSETFTIPEIYFASLEQQIINRIHLEKQENIRALDEIQQLSPVLAQVVHENTYTVNADFFEQNVTKLIHISDNTHSMDMRSPVRKMIYKLAIAASFIGIVVLGSVLLINSNKEASIVEQGLKIKTDQQFNQQLAKLETDDIINFLGHHYLPYENDEIGAMIDPASLPNEDAYFDEAVLEALLLTN